jgi:hypothetical protein
MAKPFWLERGRAQPSPYMNLILFIFLETGE